MINRVCYEGRLTKDIELQRTEKNNKLVCNFTLANKRRKNEEANFVQFRAWEKTAELLHTYTKKGTLLNVDGHLHTYNYKNKEGMTVYVTEVVVDDFSILSGFKDDTEEENTQDEVDFMEDDLPY